MSSYLTFYLISKEDDTKKPLSLWSYSGNSDVYQAFQKYANIAYIGLGETSNYTEITEHLINKVIKGLEEEIEEAKTELKDINSATGSITAINSDIYGNYLSCYAQKVKIIRELKSTLNEVHFINNTLEDLKYSSFSKMLANID